MIWVSNRVQATFDGIASASGRIVQKVVESYWDVSSPEYTKADVEDTMSVVVPVLVQLYELRHMAALKGVNAMFTIEHKDPDGNDNIDASAGVGGGVGGGGGGGRPTNRRHG